jgi:hypothetical protein
MAQPWVDIHPTNLWLILLGVVIFGFVVVLIAVLMRSGSQRTKIKGDNNIVNQIDRSVRQTQINNDVHITIRQDAPRPEPERRSSPQARSSNVDESVFALWMLGLVLVAAVFLRWSSQIQFIAVVLYAFAVGGSLALLTVRFMGLLTNAGVAPRALFLLALSVLSGMLLLDAQDLIDSGLTRAAQLLPISVRGLLDLIKLTWINALWQQTLAVALIFAGGLFVAVRIVLLCGKVTRSALSESRPLPNWSSLWLLSIAPILMLATRFLWLPYALTL